MYTIRTLLILLIFRILKSIQKIILLNICLVQSLISSSGIIYIKFHWGLIKAILRWIFNHDWILRANIRWILR